jgi:hypothetical protein
MRLNATGRREKESASGGRAVGMRQEIKTLFLVRRRRKQKRVK